MTELSDLPIRDSLKGRTPYGAPQLHVPIALNVNENSHRIPEVVAVDVVSRLAAAVININRYPDREFLELREKLAKYLGFDLTAEQLCEIVALHDATGHVDYITVGYGSYLEFEGIIPAFTMGEKLTTPLTTQLKSIVRHAAITSEAGIRTPDNAETILASGEADLVSIVRGQIADPHLARKTAEGRAEDVRGCISCNQMCWGRRSRDYWISCLINPSAGREWEWGGDRFTPAEKPRKVLVVGGGVAGLEAARVAAERGHQVTLAEASDKLGGQFRLAGLTPRRHQIIDYLDWFERQLAKLQVKVLLNTPLDAEEARAFGADEIIVATGSMPDGRLWAV